MLLLESKSSGYNFVINVDLLIQQEFNQKPFSSLLENICNM